MYNSFIKSRTFLVQIHKQRRLDNMVNLLTGPKGSGKTQQMIERANEAVKTCEGNVFFIKKSHRHTAYLSTSERSAWMTMM